MKPAFGVLLFFLVTLFLASPVKSGELVVDIDPTESDTKLQEDYPKKQDAVEPGGKESKSAIILLLSIGLVGLAGVGKKRFGKTRHEEDITP